MRSEKEESCGERNVPLSVPCLQGNEWRYIKECLDTNWVSSAGEYVNRFERMVADYTGARYTVAVVNGTAALHVALLTAGVKPDDEVLVSALSFIAPANAIRYAGAWPVFIDADPDYGQIRPDLVRGFIERECVNKNEGLYNRHSGRRVAAIMPVHILGHPVDVDSLIETVRAYNLRIIEDAAESIGARYKGRCAGALGDIGCFSFNGNKIITAGGGGMVVTNDEQWAKRARYLTTQAKDDDVEFAHNEIGFNYRLTNIQAAMGCAQMEQLDAFISKKREIARRYTEAFQEVPGITAFAEAAWARSTFWLYTIRVDAACFGMDSRTLMRHLSSSGIQSRPLWQPLHLTKAHQGSQYLGTGTAEQLQRLSLSLPCSPGLTREQQERVIDCIRRACR